MNRPGRAAALVALLAVCCRPPAAPRSEAGAAAVGSSPHPIVLITLSSWRPDTVGALGASRREWSPNVDAFAREADWVGTAVAASSASATALVSLMSGVSPWQHQILRARSSPPRPRVSLLSEDLSRAGYRTVARVPRPDNLERFGLLGGFEDVAEIEPIARASSLLSDLDEDQSAFYWFHLWEAGPPFERRDGRLPRLRSSTPLPRRISIQRLLRYADPRLPLPADERQQIWRLYGHEVALADRQVGMILKALRASGAWDRSWVVVTASQGMELGEHGQIFFAQNLGRESIEVPLLIKLPESLRGSLAVRDDTRVSHLRLWATLAEAGGRRPEPIRTPSLFRAGTPSILSELYQRDGVNEFSWLDGDLQLLWTTRFADAEPEFYGAQMAVTGGQPTLEESAKTIVDRLSAAFERSLPLSGRNGGPAPTLRLERWTEAGTELVDDPARARAMAVSLQRRWLRQVDRERTPKEESTLSAPRR